MTQLAVLVLSITLLAPALCYAQGSSDGVRRNGTWWLDLDSVDAQTSFADFGLTYKVTFAAGILDGVIHTGSGVASIGTLFAGDISDEIYKGYEVAVKKVTTGVAPRQLSDGLDAFFADFRNREISVANAAFIVLGQIASMPDEFIDSMIETFRRLGQEDAQANAP